MNGVTEAVLTYYENEVSGQVFILYVIFNGIFFFCLI